MGQTFRITGPSSAGGRLCLLSNFQERKMNVFMARPRPSLFPICQGGPPTIPYQIVHHHHIMPCHTKPYPYTVYMGMVWYYTPYQTRMVHPPYHIKMYMTTASCPATQNHTHNHHTILQPTPLFFTTIEHRRPRLTKVDHTWIC